LSVSWLAYLPPSIRSYLDPDHSLKPIVGNISWLFLEKAIRLAIGIGVGARVARYLGPGRYGDLAYAIAFVAFFQTIGRVAHEGIVVRDIAQTEADANRILGTVLWIRLLTGFVSWFLAVGGMIILRPTDRTSIALVATVAGTIIFQASDTVDLWFQSQTQSRRTVVAKTAALLVTSTLKIVLIVAHASLEAFAVVTLLDAAFCALSLAIVYRWFPTAKPWAGSAAIARRLISESWPLLISTFSVMIYMRIDTIMLRQMVSDREVGIFSAALTLSEAWYFIPTAIVTSVAATIARLRPENYPAYERAMARLFGILTWATLGIALAVALTSSLSVGLIYGPAYRQSAPVLAIHVFNNLFVAMGVAQGLWIFNEKKTRLPVFQTALGAVVSVVLNLKLIPVYGAMGAAVSAVSSQLTAAFLSNYLLAPKLFAIQCRAFLLRT
jgi:PST family polysaccharide transporter